MSYRFVTIAWILEIIRLSVKQDQFTVSNFYELLQLAIFDILWFFEVNNKTTVWQIFMCMRILQNGSTEICEI